MEQKRLSQQTRPLTSNALAVCRVVLVILFVIISTLTVASHTNPQESPSAVDPDCKCETILKSLVSKVESNYVGFSLEGFAKRAAQYRSFKEALRKRAQATSSRNCVFVLQDFVRFFEDGHMFINETPKLTDEDVARLTATAQQTGRKEDDI